MNELAIKIQDAQVKRAKFISENAQHLAPLGHRSGALHQADAKLYLAMIEGLDGKKTTIDERDAIFEGVKAANLERINLNLTMNKSNEMLALMDAEIESLRLCFEAYKAG
jgi:hypothetical protein